MEPSAEQLAGPELDWAKTAETEEGPSLPPGTSPFRRSLSNSPLRKGQEREETDEVPVQQERLVLSGKTLADAQASLMPSHH